MKISNGPVAGEVGLHPAGLQPAGRHESLAAWIAGGGEGQRNVAVNKSQRLIVDTPGVPSSRAVVLDWLRVGGDPLMRRVQLVAVDRATGLAYAGDSVTAEYLVGGAGSSAGRRPDVRISQAHAEAHRHGAARSLAGGAGDGAGGG